jgi:hypothetical protein
MEPFMKHVGPIELHNLSLAPEAFSRPVKRKSFFKRMLVALHRSRRRQAQNVIRRYRNLLVEDPWGQPANSFINFKNKNESSQNANADQTAVRTSSRAGRA